VCRESLRSSLLFEIKTDQFRTVILKRNMFEAWLECMDETFQLMKQKEQEDTLQTLRKQEEEGKRLEAARQEQASQEQRLIKEQHRDKRLHQIAALLGRRSERAMLQHSFSGFWYASIFRIPLRCNEMLINIIAKPFTLLLTCVNKEVIIRRTTCVSLSINTLVRVLTGLT
jgi:hypothetical protein